MEIALGEEAKQPIKCKYVKCILYQMVINFKKTSEGGKPERGAN